MDTRTATHIPACVGYPPQVVQEECHPLKPRHSGDPGPKRRDGDRSCGRGGGTDVVRDDKNVPREGSDRLCVVSVWVVGEFVLPASGDTGEPGCFDSVRRRLVHLCQ